jgi:hypothetical protein
VEAFSHGLEAFSDDMTIQEYRQLRAQGLTPEEIAHQQKSNKLTLGKALKNTATKAADAVTDFIGARPIADTFGAEIARAQADTPEEKNYTSSTAPSLKKVTGSALQTGSLLIPTGGIARGASKLATPLVGKTAANIAGKGAAGATVGYGLDVGKNLQGDGPELRPGAATAIGAALPILSSILGLSIKSAPRKLEEINLRLTPVERQNLQKSGKDIASYLSKKRLVGTPSQRYARVNTLYDDMEKQVQDTITKSGKVFSKTQVLKELDEIPEQFTNDPELFTEATNVINRYKQVILDKHSTQIDAAVINEFKRNLFKRAYAANSSDVVSDARLAMGGYFKKMLDDNIDGLQSLNKEYGYLIAAKRALFKASSRPELGLVGKLTGAAAGTAIGTGLGGAAGAAAGALLGPQVGKIALGTLPRSAAGATLQTISQSLQKLPSTNGQVSLKSVLALIESLRLPSELDTD